MPTRLFHWALVVCVIGLVVTANVGGNAMNWHFRFGYSVLTLLLFRLVWGLIGGRWSRFARFVYSPGSLLRHLRGEGPPEHSVGHSPTGALSVFALLLVLVAQVGSGLMSDDDIAFAGPFTGLVSGETVSLGDELPQGNRQGHSHCAGDLAPACHRLLQGDQENQSGGPHGERRQAAGHAC
ncbi:MAG: cytochrome b/b6 domain-containing protein [Burkholderiaceae bacterium]